MAMFGSRFTTHHILLVPSLIKKILWEIPRKNVTIFLVSLCKNTTPMKMIVLTVENSKYAIALMVVLVMLSLQENRMNLVNDTRNLFFSLRKCVVNPPLVEL